MDFLTLLAIALGLSMDAFAIAVASGAVMGRLHMPHALRMSAFFGGFQALMPILGWLAGIGLRSYIETFDHWLAFGLLAVIGGKMCYESFQLEEKERASCPESGAVLLTLAIATSIDALAVGLSFSFLKISVPLPAVFIGIVTFCVTYLGVYVGAKVGHFFEKKIGLLGGLMLIAIGVRILVEHLKG